MFSVSLEQLEPKGKEDEHAQGDVSAPRSEFSHLRFTNDELPHMEIRALASIGAGLLERHRGDAKAARKLARLATTFDNYRKNETAKALNVLCEEAAGQDYDDTGEILAELATRSRCAALGLSFDQAQRIALASGSTLPLALGLDFVTFAPLKPRRWLWMAAQTSSVRYRGLLTPELLLEILTTGEVPRGFASHVLHLLEEAPIQIVVLAVEQAAQQSGLPITTIWRNVAQIADELQSQRITASMVGDAK